MAKFTSTDFEYVASLLRSEDSGVVRAALSNNYNIILAALDAAVIATKMADIAAALSEQVPALKDTVENIAV